MSYYVLLHNKSKIITILLYLRYFLKVVSGPVVDMLGGKTILAIANLVAGTMTLLVPVLATRSVPLLILTQVVSGVANGVAVPSFHSMIGRWEPVSERGIVCEDCENKFCESLT